MEPESHGAPAPEPSSQEPPLESDATSPPRHDASPPAEEQDPGLGPVRDFLLYTLSLPERTVRTASGVVGGALREGAGLLVPQAFQSSKVYSTFVRQTLDFMAEDVGGVARQEDAAGAGKVENFVARKAVGNFVEMGSMATLHLSPMLLLAVVSDVAYGSHAFIEELADELKQHGVIDETSTIHNVDDFVEAVAQASKCTASLFDTPPLSVDGLKETVEETRRAVACMDPTRVLPQSEVAKLWTDMHQIAREQGVNPLAVSGAVTLYSLDKIANVGRGAISACRAAGTLFDRHVIDHYRDALGDIQKRGIYRVLADTSKPYIEAVWNNYSGKTATITEDLLTGRLILRGLRALRDLVWRKPSLNPPQPPKA